jgi:hypothetical protein
MRAWVSTLLSPARRSRIQTGNCKALITAQRIESRIKVTSHRPPKQRTRRGINFGRVAHLEGLNSDTISMLSPARL